MYNPLQNAGIFLIKTLFNIYIYLVLLRFLLQLLRADFYNPICQFIIKATNPLLMPLRRFVPGLFGLDVSAIFLMVLLEFAQLISLVFVSSGSFIKFTLTSFAGVLLWIVGQILDQAIGLFVFSIIIYALLSWFSQSGYNPIVAILHSICSPILNYTRRILPFAVVGGIDLTPLFVLIILQMLNFLLSEPLIYYSRFLLAA